MTPFGVKLIRNQVLYRAAQDLPYQPLTSYLLWSLHMHAAAGELKQKHLLSSDPNCLGGYVCTWTADCEPLSCWSALHTTICTAQPYVLAKIASEMLMVVEEVKA